MTSNNFAEGFSTAQNSESQSQMVDRVAKEIGVSEYALSAEVYECKDNWCFRDLTYLEVVELAYKVKKHMHNAHC